MIMESVSYPSRHSVTTWWILIFVYVAVFNIREIFGNGVYVNINLDVLPANVPYLKIFKTNVNFTDCPYLENIGDSVFLKLEKNLTSSTCITNLTTFYIFIYHSNIASALITVENKNYSTEALRSILPKFSKNLVILDIQRDYISFVVCQETFNNCRFKGNENRAMLKDTNLTVYSACKTQNYNGSCLTDVEFLAAFNDADSNSEILGSQIKITPSTMEPKYNLPLVCYHGGIPRTDNETMRTQCSCPTTSAFVDKGPLCEVLQQRITVSQYFYNLPNTNKLLIEFSWYSPNHEGETEIFKIRHRSDTIFMRYVIKDDDHIVTCLGSSISLKRNLDLNSKWVDILILVSEKNLTLKINGEESTISVMDLSIENLKLDTYPIIFREIENPLKLIQICIRKLHINSQVIDLYTPMYVSCAPDRCSDCLDMECIYLPTKSGGSSRCICKPGFTNTIINKTCVKDTAMAGQFPADKAVQVNFTTTNFDKARFKFRTLLPNGNLVTLIMSPNQIFIGISNGLIYARISNYQIQINHYNVADGRWHTLQIELTTYMLEITLDDDIPYNSNRTWFAKGFSESWVSPQKIDSVSFGAINGTSEKSTNLICFDTLVFISYGQESNWQINAIPTKQALTEGCDHGISCLALNCTNNRRCFDSWQNSSCVCEDSFTDLNGTCFFTKCISGPCRNGGTCYFSSNLQDYFCQCPSAFTGHHCENGIAEASISWWIILLIILIVILILFIIVLFIFSKEPRHVNRRKANINEIYENMVPYLIQAGETDYEGEINLAILKKGVIQNLSLHESPLSLHQQLQDRKEYYDNNNDELILDYPLDYGHEGFNSDTDSVSSFSSASFNEALNVNSIPLQYV